MRQRQHARGQSLAEYALLVVLVAVVCAGSLQALGQVVQAAFMASAEAMASTSTGVPFSDPSPAITSESNNYPSTSLPSGGETADD